MKKILDHFFKEFAFPLVMRAGVEYRQHGRGMLLVGFADPNVKPVSAAYMPLARAEQAGFSKRTLKAVRRYNPEREALIFLNCGDRARLLRMQLDGTAGGSREN